MNMNTIARDSKRKKSKSVKVLRHAPPAKRGFALVITISLMILLVLIGVGMLTLSSITLRTTSQETAMATARANARMALMLAIGDLQRNAGPDQYVTARAEILDASPAGTVVSGVSQPYWTGTWKTGAAGLDVAHSGDPHGPQRGISFTSPSGAADRAKSAHWLVSDPTPATATTLSSYLPTTGFTPVTTGNGSSRNAVKIATNQGTNSTTQEVDVPLVKIMNPSASSTNPTGGFGYWVADEGLKAKVNMVDPTMATATPAPDAAQKQTHFLASQANAIQKVSNTKGSLVKDSTKDFRTANTTDQLGKTVTYGTIGLLPTISTGADLRTFMPDITTESRGVIVDVKNGGLKKDLTSAFETSAANTAAYTNLVTNYGYDSQSAYRNHAKLSCPSAPATTGYGNMTDGLPWIALYTYYNTYRSKLDATLLPPIAAQAVGNVTVVGYTPTTTDAGGGTQLASSLPSSVSPRFVVSNLNLPSGSACGKFGGLVPEVIAQRMDIGMMSYKSIDSTTGETLYKLQVCYHPQLVLYNPYNCRLHLPTGFYYTRRYKTGTGNGDHYINVWVDGKKVTRSTNAFAGVLLNQMTTWYGNAYVMITKGGECDDGLAPGETRVFGLVQDVQCDNLARAIICDSLMAHGKLSADRMHYADLPTYTDAPYSPDPANVPAWYQNGPPYAGTKDGNADVVVSIDSPNQVTYTYETKCNDGEVFIDPNTKWPCSDGGGSQHCFVVNGPDESSAGKGWPPHMAISSMLGQEYILCSYFIRTKGMNTSAATPNSKTYFDGDDLIPIFHGNAAYFSPFETYFSPSRHELFINDFGKAYSSASEVETYQKSTSDAWETYYGNYSAGINDGTTPPARRVLRDVPEQPLLSIGQFMHMPTLVSGDSGAAGNSRDPGSMYIGGSMCSPFISIDTNAMVDNNSGTLLLDDSYMANDALFDRFFFSTVPPASPDKNAPQQWTDFNTSNSGSTVVSNSPPLPNSRIKPYGRNGSLPLMSDLRDFDKAAANLMLDGAFNVNSTSVNAWTAFLSSLSGNNLHIWDAVARGSADIQSGTLQNFIPRFWSGGTGSVNQPWSAGRALSPNDVSQLAANIVQQVKTRGPFLSMSDFLNHRLGKTNSAITRVGCLQAAIDKSPINNNIKAAGTAVNAKPSGMLMTNLAPKTLPTVNTDNLHDGQDGAGSLLTTAFGMPGYLMQQDIVQAFSPAMTVRSDTFLIRAYGECVNPLTGEIQAKAWAEAVVQRVPDFVDSTTDPDPSVAIQTDPSGNANPVPTGVAKLNSTTVNLNLGRRFKVAGFRWLSQNEL